MNILASVFVASRPALLKIIKGWLAIVNISLTTVFFLFAGLRALTPTRLLQNLTRYRAKPFHDHEYGDQGGYPHVEPRE